MLIVDQRKPKWPNMQINVLQIEGFDLRFTCIQLQIPENPWRCSLTGFGGHSKGHLASRCRMSGNFTAVFILFKGFVVLLLADKVCVGVSFSRLSAFLSWECFRERFSAIQRLNLSDS